MRALAAAFLGRAGAGRRRTASLAFLVVFFVLSAVAGVSSYHPEQRLSESWSVPAAAAALLTLLWPGGGSTFRRLAPALAGLVATYVLVTVPAGLAPLAALWIGVVNVAVPWLALAGYHRYCGGWFPRRTEHVIAFAGLAAVAAVAIVLLGGVPQAGLGGTGALRYDVAWAIRIEINVTFTGLVVFALWHGPRPAYTRVEYRPFLPLMLVLAAACLTLPYLYPQYPLAWLVFVPWVWLGMALTPRLAGLAAIVMVVAPSALARSTYSRFSGDSWIPPALLLEQLMICALILGFVILALRENTARLAARASAAAAAEAAGNVLLESVLRSVEDGVLLVDRRGLILSSNPAARTLLGRPRSDRQAPWPVAYGLLARDGTALPPEAVDALVEPPREGSRVRVRVAGGEGTEWFHAISARPVPQLRPPLTLVVITDVTAEETRHAQLETFAGTVAHDLKNPLAALTLWMDLAEAEVAEDAARGRESLQRASEVADRMRMVIDDYLAYTVTREGTLNPAVVDLTAAVAEVASLYDVGEQAATVDIVGSADVMADPALLRQLLANLLANSVKYARPGNPTRILVHTEPDSEAGWVRVSVADRGIGIPPADRERVFRPFSRSRRGEATGRSGIGLGLALCQAIVTRHGGRIAASGNEWGGTTMTFTLPEARAAVPT